MTIKGFTTRITLNMNITLIILILSTKNVSDKNNDKSNNYYNSKINLNVNVNNTDIDSKINLNKFYADEIKNVFSLKLL